MKKLFIAKEVEGVYHNWTTLFIAGNVDPRHIISTYRTEPAMRDAFNKQIRFGALDTSFKIRTVAEIIEIVSDTTIVTIETTNIPDVPWVIDYKNLHIIIPAGKWGFETAIREVHERGIINRIQVKITTEKFTFLSPLSQFLINHKRAQRR